MKKILTSIIGTVVLLGGGGSAYYDTQLEKKDVLLGGVEAELSVTQEELEMTKIERDTAKIQKFEIVKDNSYKNIRLGEKPEYTLDITLNEFQSAYASLAEEKGLKIDLNNPDINVYNELRKYAESKSEACNI